MSTVRQINATNGDVAWRYYDENLRMLREFSSLRWQQPLGELMVRATTILKSTQNNFRPSNKTRMQSFRGTTTFKHVSLPRVHSTISAFIVKTTIPDFNVQKQKSHPFVLVVNPQNPIIISKKPKSSQPRKPV